MNAKPLFSSKISKILIFSHNLRHYNIRFPSLELIYSTWQRC